MDTAEGCLQAFYEIVTSNTTDIRAALRSFVEVGRRTFGCETGFVGQKIGGVVRLLVCESDLDSLYDGQLLTAGEPLVDRFLVNASEKIAENLTFSPLQALNLSYNGTRVQKVVAKPIVANGETFGLLCFFSTTSFQHNKSVDNPSTIDLMAKGVTKMIELQSQVKDKPIVASYVTEGVKHFDDYLMQAKIPEVYGVAGKVVEVLKRRIGHAPLSIGDIAGDMSLSKRTLQRRLQQQDLSFADLRDKVRFHYSIDFLIEQQASIDSISGALDFSDRTSFTNAFKRWTGLSPSTFRKLFRDYA